ncbi:LPS translocon maturation chaperone LptM [Sphingomicrobium lutaoense]|uniref:Putative small lipoprotein YifL n=2 Tax=Sphingomicrobium lutaoense TaxID=515949 RepID=A0A839Z784_9SPHN|nr:lipoprotein [Sphingomicrobium lutaoense]MBB3764664.1 putative small lipoprotein YifL [Sphingomicrobium lutaoense]
MRNILLLAAACAALAACGTTGPLKPEKGESLPVKPALADRQPDADDLLTPPPYARPERIDELVKRSTPREPDRFDLPPPEGGAAPEPDPASDVDDPVDQDSDIEGPEGASR